MLFYVEKNNEIVLYNADRRALEDSLQFYPQYQGLGISVTDEEIVAFQGKYYFKSDIEQQLYNKRYTDFHKAFFHTSLGYVRRNVTMKDGSQKDFLTDLFTPIVTAVNLGQEVSIFTYDAPDFNEDVEDWVQYQHRVTVTPTFIQECFTQLSNDFFV